MFWEIGTHNTCINLNLNCLGNLQQLNISLDDVITTCLHTTFLTLFCSSICLLSRWFYLFINLFAQSLMYELNMLLLTSNTRKMPQNGHRINLKAKPSLTSYGDDQQLINQSDWNNKKGHLLFGRQTRTISCNKSIMSRLKCMKIKLDKNGWIRVPVLERSKLMVDSVLTLNVKSL